MAVVWVFLTNFFGKLSSFHCRYFLVPTETYHQIPAFCLKIYSNSVPQACDFKLILQCWHTNHNHLDFVLFGCYYLKTYFPTLIPDLRRKPNLIKSQKLKKKVHVSLPFPLGKGGEKKFKALFWKCQKEHLQLIIIKKKIKINQKTMPTDSNPQNPTQMLYSDIYPFPPPQRKLYFFLCGQETGENTWRRVTLPVFALPFSYYRGIHPQPLLRAEYSNTQILSLS